MGVYPDKVQGLFRSPSRAGAVPDPNAAGRSASFVCGSFVSFSFKIDETSGNIEDVRFRTNGCGFTTAAAEVMSTWLVGKSVVDLHGLDAAELSEMLSVKLGRFPEGRTHCAVLVFEAVRDAMAAYRRHRIEEFRGEKALICTCFGVSEDTIEAVIAEINAAYVDDVAAACRAGSGCGSCRMLIQEMIDARTFEGRSA